MRPIPVALKNKLLSRFLAGADAPQIRLVATQISTNTLISEPIHTGTAAYGDVTFRQASGEDSISYAYALCVDNGVAKVYHREFPAIMANEWEYEWSPGTASDVAIEYDGEWLLDKAQERYFLQTDQYPYIFLVQQGVLTVQKWNDTTTATQLATGVATVSSVKGWSNSIDIEQDQGLLIAYIKTDGTVWYRAYAMQENGTKIWETERQITDFGSTNVTIAVTRTNDFRLAFIVEQSGGSMKMMLTTRNYAGMSVRPETIHAGTSAAMDFFEPEIKYGYHNETVTATITQPFLLLDEAAGTPNLTVLSAVRNNNQENRLTESVTLTLSHALYGTVDAYFVAGTTASALVSGTATPVAVSGIVYNGTDHTLTISFSDPPRKSLQLTVTTPINHAMSFKKNQDMKWYMPSLTATLEPQVNNLYGYAPDETITATTTAELEYLVPDFHATFENETVGAATTATVTLTAASIEPI